MRNSELMRSRANVSVLHSGRTESDLQAVEGISPAGKIIMKGKGKGGHSYPGCKPLCFPLLLLLPWKVTPFCSRERTAARTNYRPS